MRQKNILIGFGVAVIAFLSGLTAALFLAYHISMDLEKERELHAFDPYFAPDIEIGLNLWKLELLEAGNTAPLFEWNCMYLRSNLELLNHATFEIEERERITDLVKTAEDKLAQLKSQGRCTSRSVPLEPAIIGE